MQEISGFKECYFCHLNGKNNQFARTDDHPARLFYGDNNGLRGSSVGDVNINQRKMYLYVPIKGRIIRRIKLASIKDG
jgi:hypothetical protein